MRYEIYTRMDIPGQFCISLILWYSSSQPLIFEESIVSTYQTRRQHLMDLGFSDKTIEIWEKQTPKLFSEEFVNAKLRYGRKLSRFGVDGVALARAFPPLLGYSIKRIRLLARIIFSLEDGDAAAFLSLITKEPLSVVAGQLSTNRLTKQGLQQSIRIRKGRNEVTRTPYFRQVVEINRHN